MFHTILFDLDGTLSDSAGGILNSVRYALNEMSLPIPSPQELYQFVGPPLQDSFRTFCHLDEDTAREAVRQYRVYYNVTGIWENEIYSGIPDLLARLKEAGRRVVLATSKPEPAARRILEHFALAPYFDCIAGASPDDVRTKKADVISYALDLCGLAPDAGTVMVGDRDYDILGAKEIGIPSVGVLYGYGSRAELEDAGADAIAEDVAQLGEILLA